MAELEKLSVNISVVDLGQIDLLVDQGFYPSRTDFLRTAIRTQLNTHTEELRQTVKRRAMFMGVLIYDRADLEKIKQAGEQLEINAVGLLSFSADITPTLALETIAFINVFGSFRASPAVKAALDQAGRIKK